MTSGGIIAGSAVGGKAMAKRTRHVKTFEFQPLHNNKRVNFFLAVPGCALSLSDRDAADDRLVADL